MNLFVSIISGVVLGGLATMLWIGLGPWLSDKTVWSSLRELASSLLSGSPSEDFVRQYFAMLRALGIYLVKTTCRVCISVLPVVGGLTLLTPLIAETQLKQADGLGIYPEQPITVRCGHRTMYATDGLYDLPSRKVDDCVTLATADWSSNLPFAEPVVISSSDISRPSPRI